MEKDNNNDYMRVETDAGLLTVRTSENVVKTEGSRNQIEIVKETEKDHYFEHINSKKENENIQSITYKYWTTISYSGFSCTLQLRCLVPMKTILQLFTQTYNICQTWLLNHKHCK